MRWTRSLNRASHSCEYLAIINNVKAELSKRRKDGKAHRSRAVRKKVES